VIELIDLAVLSESKDKQEYNYQDDFLALLHRNSFILDVGCGFGRITKKLADYGTVVGVDIDICFRISTDLW